MYYLAVDIGASGGRHILGTIENGQITTQEIHRFKNGAVKRNGRYCWEVDRLFSEIVAGMKKCAELGKIPVSMAIDCFAVDFVLLDKNGEIVGDSVSYRDKRTNGMCASGVMDLDKLYHTTGKLPGDIDSLFQLISVKQNSDELERAERFLQLPEYFNYLLTGVDLNEYTNSESTSIINPSIRDFDKEILKDAGIPERLFKKPGLPMTEVGPLKPEIEAQVGFNCKVILPAAHDTVSAFTAVPVPEDSIFISSGTWSMVGTYIEKPIISEKARNYGFTNMYVYDDVTACVKGITGLWMIQSVKRELNDEFSYDDLCDMARASEYEGVIDVNDKCFMAPDSMIEEVTRYLKENTGKAPEKTGDIVKSIYHGLAKKYAQTIAEIEDLTGKTYSIFNIMGGGSKDPYLNELAAQYSGKAVYAGPTEATAIGNLMAQMVAMGEFSSINEAKKAVPKSEPIK